jgi:hypothetical protein
MMALPDGQYEDIDLASDIVLQTYQDLMRTLRYSANMFIPRSREIQYCYDTIVDTDHMNSDSIFPQCERAHEHR